MFMFSNHFYKSPRAFWLYFALWKTVKLSSKVALTFFILTSSLSEFLIAWYAHQCWLLLTFWILAILKGIHFYFFVICSSLMSGAMNIFVCFFIIYHLWLKYLAYFKLSHFINFKLYWSFTYFDHQCL